jgi:SAM-dependent methyltransferase
MKPYNLYTQAQLRAHVIKHGCYSREQNLQIYERWFSNAPRYVFRAVARKYGITKKALCDVGCAYGANLFYCAPGSYGIEIDKARSEFARSLGLTVYQLNVTEDELAQLPRVEAIWCSAVLEHVYAPHTFLKKLLTLLKAGGLLALYVPTIPLFSSLKKLPKLGKYVSGYAAKDHITAFVPATLQFTCERAGFKTVAVCPFYPGLLRVFDHIPVFNRLTGRCVYIGKKEPFCF